MLNLITVSPVINAFHCCCHLKKARGEICPKRSEKKQQQNYQDEDKKSAIKKKINSQIKKPYLKRIHNQDKAASRAIFF